MASTTERLTTWLSEVLNFREPTCWTRTVGRAFLISIGALVFGHCHSLGGATVTFTNPGSGSWTAPAGVTSVTVEAWGGGGGGGTDTANGGGGAGGGGGGAYARVNTFTVTPGNSYSYTVGAGGAAGATGGNSTFNGATCIAAGGSAGTGGGGGAGGAGGTTAGSTGNVRFAGGNGASGGTGASSGGGGGSGGTASAGNNASGTLGGAAVTDGGPGAAGLSANGVGNSPLTGPGGGGSGGAGVSGTGGTGFAGQVRITFTLPTPTFSNLNVSQSSITYGDATVTISGRLSAAGPVYPASGETVTITIGDNSQNTTINSSTGDFSLAYNTATLPASGSPYTVTISYSGSLFLNSATDTSQTLTINPRPVSLSGTRQYDGTTAADAAVLTVANNIDGANLILSGGGVLASPNVGSQSISAGTLALGGSAAGNYTLVGLSGSVTITTRPVNLTGTREYDGTTTAAAGILTIVNNVDGGNLTLSGSGVLANVSVGSQAISAGTLTLGGSAAGNYTLSGLIGSVTITHRSANLTGTRQYDGTTTAAAAILTIVNNVDGGNLTLSGNGVLAAANVGSQGVSAGTLALGGSAAGNYTLSGLTGAVIITARPVDLTGARQYDGTTSVAASFLTVGNKVNGDDLTLSGSVTIASASAGSQSISSVDHLTLDGTAVANYTKTGFTGSVTINDTAAKNLASITVLDNGDLELTFYGIPNVWYTPQRSVDAGFTSPQDLTDAQASPAGKVIFADTPSNPAGFYRIRYSTNSH